MIQYFFLEFHHSRILLVINNLICLLFQVVNNPIYEEEVDDSTEYEDEDEADKESYRSWETCVITGQTVKSQLSMSMTEVRVFMNLEDIKQILIVVCIQKNFNKVVNV